MIEQAQALWRRISKEDRHSKKCEIIHHTQTHQYTETNLHAQIQSHVPEEDYWI
jgi:hypothetical protein